jgi:acetyl-CoA carboxylase alpha subunit
MRRAETLSRNANHPPPQLRKETYSRLTPTQRLQVARHPNRPTCLDIILNITDKFVELHGDRAGLDDPAIVCGIGSIDGTSFMFIGQQKGRNTKVRVPLAVQWGGGARGYLPCIHACKLWDPHSCPCSLIPNPS